MFRKEFWSKSLGFPILAAFLLIAYVASTFTIPSTWGGASYTGAAKPMEFYLHYLDIPVDVAGIQTKYVIDTSRSFSFQTQQEAHANSFYKPVGQPKIAVDFYLYPNFAGRVNIDGLWQVLLWVNGSAYKPTGFMLEFTEVTSGGVTLWDSGAINPQVTSSLGQYIDVPVYNYNLSTPLTHTFNVNTTLHVYIEVNAGSVADTRIWFDSQFYPSKVILPAEDYARPVKVKTYAYDNSETNMFYYNWSDSQRVVTFRANVTDPFGGYDVNSVKMTLVDPVGKIVLDDVEMVRQADDQWETRFELMYEAKWAYPETVQRGNYTVKVSVIDNNGYYRGQPFTEQNDHVFTIGIIIYYNPAFLVVDDVEAPLANAQVFITWPNGTMDALPHVTTVTGFVNLTHVLPAEYSFTILWKDALVKQATINVDSDGPYVIKTDVYQVKITVVGNNAAPIHGAYVIVYTETELGYGLDITEASGQAVFKLPKGTYSIEAHFVTEYWLKIVTASASEQDVIVNASTSKNIVLADFPPPIWTTTGFWLMLVVFGGSIFAVVLVMILTHSRFSTIRKRLSRH